MTCLTAAKGSPNSWAILLSLTPARLAARMAFTFPGARPLAKSLGLRCRMERPALALPSGFHSGARRPRRRASAATTPRSHSTSSSLQRTIMRPKSSGPMSSAPAEGIGAGGVAGGAGVRGTVAMLKRSGSEIGRARRGMVRRVVSLKSEDQASPRGSRPFEPIVRFRVADLTGRRDRNSRTGVEFPITGPDCRREGAAACIEARDLAGGFLPAVVAFFDASRFALALVRAAAVLFCAALVGAALVFWAGFPRAGAVLAKAICAAVPLAATWRGASSAASGSGSAAGAPPSAISRPKSAARSSPTNVFPASGPFRAPSRAAPRSASNAVSSTARSRNNSSGLWSSRAPMP
jgi:hypothetical protein